MSTNSTLVPFAPPQPRRRDDVSGARPPVTEAERVVIRMLARRAAQRWLAETTGRAPSTESAE